MAAALPGTETHPHARAVLGAGLPPEGSPSHAYLFHGPAGTGKRSVARAFAAALLADGAADPAGAAARVERGSHPDLTWVAPTGAAVMLVGDIDEPVVAAASRTPFEASRRVFVIEAADTMNDQAANRLLKTLEEPAPFVHLILLSDRPTEVLPTVASRCQPVRFDPLPPSALAARLEGHGVAPETARACALLSLGDGERALSPATDEGPDLRKAAEAFARAALTGELDGRPWEAVLKQAKRAGERAATAIDAQLEETLEMVPSKDRKTHEREAAERRKRADRRARTRALDQGLALVGLWYRDLACVADGAPDLALHADRADQLAADAAGHDSHAFRDALELVEDTRQRLALHVSEDLACEALAYRLARRLS
jgi:DNA polymerase III subunit delta'